MKTPWLVRMAARSHPLLVPCLYLFCALGYLSLVTAVSSGQSIAWKTAGALWGTILVYCLLPPYFLFCQPFTWKRTRSALESLAALLPDFDKARRRVLDVPLRTQLVGVALGALQGFLQYSEMIRQLETSDAVLLEISMTAANIGVWSTIGWLLAVRLYSSSGLAVIGRSLPVNLYDQQSLRPLVQVAMLDVLVVMGAVALMPLQSLDAQFRWANYQAGLVISIPSALLFFLLPLLGVHQALKARKLARIKELQAAINRCDHADIVRLHALVEHQQAVRAMHTWPVDLRLVSRALFYLVIPPLAWIGAALAEKLVERFI